VVFAGAVFEVDKAVLFALVVEDSRFGFCAAELVLLSAAKVSFFIQPVEVRG
jgi:hypothetical protein